MIQHYYLIIQQRGYDVPRAVCCGAVNHHYKRFFLHERCGHFCEEFTFKLSDLVSGERSLVEEGDVLSHGAEDLAACEL